MNNMVHIHLLKTASFILFCSTNIHSQPLYENDIQSFHTLDGERKESPVQSLLNATQANLKKKVLTLEECNGRYTSIVDAYKHLLEMTRKGLVPNDKTIDEICSRQPGLIMKSANDCHRYYNCSGEDFELSNWVEMYKFWPSKYKHECHYPLMYSEETMRCESYSNVECGTRYKPIWECRYFRLTCKLGKCKPCEQEYPSCENTADGLWPWPEYSHRPTYYMQCKNGRRIKRGDCPYDPVWGVASFPYKGQCVHLFAVPKDYNPHGELPSCLGKVDGNYQYLVGYCPGYYKCESGVATAVKCPNNMLFDTASRTCKIGGKCIY